MNSEASTAPSPPRRRLLVAFGIKGYPWFWGSMFWTSAGLSARMVAQSWLILDLTGASAPLWLGVAATLSSVGTIGLAPLGGIAADRFDRRHILLVTQGMNMLGSVLLGTLIVADWVRLWHVLAIMMVQGLSMSVDTPTRNALTFDLAGKRSILNAMSANYLAMDLTRMVSPVASGLLTAKLGPGVAFFFVGATYLIGSGCVAMLPAAPRSPRATASVWRSLKEGIAYAARVPSIRAIMIMDLVTSLFAFSYMIMLPVFARDVLDLGPTGLGVLMAAPGLGAFAMGVVIASWPGVHLGHRGFFMSAVGFSTGVLLFSQSPWFPLSLVFLVLLGLCAAWYNSMATSLIQVAASDELRGRMVGIQVFTWGGVSLGGLLAGVFASVIGAPLSVGALAVVSTAISARMLLRAKHYTRQA